MHKIYLCYGEHTCSKSKHTYTETTRINRTTKHNIYNLLQLRSYLYNRFVCSWFDGYDFRCCTWAGLQDNFNYNNNLPCDMVLCFSGSRVDRPAWLCQPQRRVPVGHERARDSPKPSLGSAPAGLHQAPPERGLRPDREGRSVALARRAVHDTRALHLSTTRLISCME